MFVLTLHLALYQTGSVLILLVEFDARHAIGKFLFSLSNFFEIGLLSPGILNQVMLLYFIDMKKIELVYLIQQKLH